MMTELHAALAPRVAEWRDAGYPHDRYPAISEILSFAPDLIDVPERKSDVVSGTYDVEIPDGATLPVAVRITDMLGEEILVVEDRPGV
jgi:hypothetical protein